MNHMTGGQQTTDAPPLAQVDPPSDRLNTPNDAASDSPNDAPVHRSRAALAGALAGGASLATGELFSGLTDKVRSLVISVAEAVVDWTPGGVARWSIDLFGSYQKTLLVWGIVLISLAVGAFLGRASLRNRLAGWIGFGLFGVVGGIAAARVPGNSAGLSWLAALVAAAVGALLLTLMLGALARTPATSAPENPAGRRSFMGLAFGTFGATVIAWFAGSQLRMRFSVDAAREEAAETIAAASNAAARSSSTATAEPATAVPTAAAQPTVGEEAAAAETDTTEDDAADDAMESDDSTTATSPGPASFDGEVDGISPLLVPNDDFYRIDTAIIIPQVDPADWSMKIKGLVDNELEFTYQDLLDRASQLEPVTLSCVSNGVGGSLVGNAEWLGVPLRDLLAEAGVQPAAAQLASRSVDGWNCGFPLEVLDDPNRVAMVAVAMNGEPLPAVHGFPARLVIAGLYGYVSATKWLSEIELTTWEDFDGYWIPRGWSKLGPIKTQSRIDVPRQGRDLPAGLQTIAGIAWAPNTGITRVEVRVDDGEWQETELIKDLSIHSWRQWKLDWDATPGQHRIQVRATDASGYTQTDVRTDVAPDGATGHHTINVKVQA